MPLSTALSFVLVGAFWGCTTPFIKSGGISGKPASEEDGFDIKGTSRWENLMGPLRSLRSFEVVVPFALNQLGSVIYYYLLGSQDISMAVPVCNSLTFVFTAATAILLGERTMHPMRSVAGMALVLVGIAICVASKAT